MQDKDIVPELVKATMPGMVAIEVARRLIGEVVKTYQNNRSFVHDALLYDYKTAGSKTKREYVSYGDLPVSAYQQLTRLRKRYSSLASDIQTSHASDLSKAEVKWHYLYRKKYGTNKWQPGQGISDAEILRPLTKEQVQECQRLY